jgi:hypothetical protein
VPGGGISLDGSRWISSAEDYLLPVPVLSRMFRGKMLAMLKTAHNAGRLQFFGPHEDLADKAAFKAFLEPLYHTKWHVYAKRPFAGPEQVLAYLARYTHRVAISSSRLIGADEQGVTFKYKDYRSEGPGRYKTMTVAPGEFIRRFMLHILPKGFHRIRHYGLLANGNRVEAIATARELLGQAVVESDDAPAGTDAAGDPQGLPRRCPCCGSAMRIIETFPRGSEPRHRPSSIVISIDTS